MDEFLADLRELDETQERVEAVSDGMLRVQRTGDPIKARMMAESWIQALRASDFQSERVAFLYVANHVLQKTLFGDPENGKTPLFVSLFSQYLEEAVALVCNSPMDRQNVTRLLELWHEKQVFTNTQVLKMWRCTGEDLPHFLENAASMNGIAGDKQGEMKNIDAKRELPDSHDAVDELHDELPIKLNSHSVNPVLDVLKKMDHHRAAVKFLDQKIKERHQVLLNDTIARYQTAADLVEDKSIASSQIRQRAEDCLRLVKVRNKFMSELGDLKEKLSEAVVDMIDYEEEAATKIEQKLEQCDEIDLGLMDLADHQKKFPEEWLRARFVSLERRKRREEIQRQKVEQIARLHQEAIAESAMHAMSLEADMNSNSASELQSLSGDLRDRPMEKDSKTDNENELVWNPIRKELVPLRSLNVDWEDWRDH
ncbi:RNA polymerase II-binding domain [Plasmopara halstedii]|uniref:RNA polymerase II-binding domain n=1 Tax=Plasmopara halstedii TaxID=4781 RepID=A0A0P1AS81_PLAHL|nr:RNA polymerase II-binding domain [Plasmopara halstedii]CEG43736.1 RNA polymerase II-binding domain [Plasmopara halstedii]|eukprot:XP_024580105.1 RNA polymerase II-binding domain [Plasmopara halstedii]